MAFIGNEKRKSILLKNTIEIEVLSVPIEQMFLKSDSGTVYFRRLGYKGCPQFKVGSKGKIFNLKNDQILQDMERWEKIKELYFIMVKLDRRARTKINIFNAMVSLIQYCDEHEIKDFYSESAIINYISNLKDKYQQGVKGKTLMQIQSSIKVILFEIDPSLLENLKPKFLSFIDDSSPCTPYSDQELKLMVMALYKIFNEYTKCLLSRTIPEIHPLYNEDILIKNNHFNNFTESSWRKKLYSKNNLNAWHYDLVKSAFYLTSFYTGANEASLINLKMSDISTDTFDQLSSGAFLLKTIKERQGGKENFIEIGFSKKAKEFFETWLLLRKTIINKDCEYIFPNIVNNDFKKAKPTTLSVTLNSTFALLNIPKLSTQRFRKTKATLIMRATESIFSVSEGLNNTPQTVSKHYSNGVSEIMEFSIAGALDVRHRSVQGEKLSEAILESAYHYSDPVREQFYLQDKLDSPSILSNGLRCKDSFGQKARQLKHTLIKAGLAKSANKVACHKFLECFGCPHHAIIAEVDDIWLMLSFRDVILEAACQPSINSIPTNILTKVIHTIESILKRLEQDFSNVFKSAIAKYSECSHPLWADNDDLDVLLELY